MNADTLLYLIIGIVLADFLLDNILRYLNLKYKNQALPEELNGIYQADEYEKSIAYQKETTQFGFLAGGLSFVITLLLLVSQSFGAIYSLVGRWMSDPILQGLLFFALLGIASDILSFPLQWYRTFLIEEKFGFNKNTLPNFLLDKLKGYLIGGLIGGVLGYAFLYLIIELGENFWIYAWLLFFGFSLFMNAFYATLFVPLFNKLTPLEEGALRSAIEAYCQKVNFPLANLFVIDGSKRSTKANAFFSGIGRQKKIVLYDTLIQEHSQEELVAVLAHEVGHYKKKHIPLNIALSSLQMGIILYILSWLIFNPSLSQALGYATLSIPLNLMAFSFLFSPISTAVGVLFNVLSRKNEFEADRYAKETYSGIALTQALKKLSVNHLSNLNPHPIYVFFNYSHPPLAQRLKALK